MDPKGVPHMSRMSRDLWFQHHKHLLLLWGAAVCWHVKRPGWFQRFFDVHPSYLGKWSNLTSMLFQRGWFNHQLETCFFCSRVLKLGRFLGWYSRKKKLYRYTHRYTQKKWFEDFLHATQKWTVIRGHGLQGGFFLICWPVVQRQQDIPKVEYEKGSNPRLLLFIGNEEPPPDNMPLRIPQPANSHGWTIQ